MLKEFIVGAAAVAAGVLPFSGVAAADDARSYGDDTDNQVGLANVSNLDVLHNVNVVAGVCDNNINVLGVQVPIRDVANGIGIPVLSPGAHEAEGSTPFNCAAGSIEDGGTIQGD